MNVSLHLNLTGDCVQTSTVPVLCLRFESPRERIALPYASLAAVELSTNEEELRLTFVTHRVVVKGHHLSDAHCAVAAGMAAVVRVGETHRMAKIDRTPNAERLAIEEIRVVAVAASAP